MTAKWGGEQAEQHEGDNRLRPLRQAGREEERLAGHAGRSSRPSLGHHRIGEEARAVGVEGGEQHRRCHGVRRRVEQREGERDRAVEDKVEDDVEEAAEVGRRRLPGHRPVEAVGEARQKDQRKAERRVAGGDRPCRRQPRRQRDGGHRVGADAVPLQLRREPVDRRIDALPHHAVQHAFPFRLPSARLTETATLPIVALQPKHHRGATCTARRRTASP